MSDRIQPLTAIRELVADHRRMQVAFQQFENMTDPLDRHAYIERIVAELNRHSNDEQRCLYPTVSRIVPGGEELATEHLEDHEISSRVMQELHLEDPGSVGFERAARMLLATTRRHMRQEENELFPLLQQACCTEQLQLLASDIEQAKPAATAPPGLAVSSGSTEAQMVASG